MERAPAGADTDTEDELLEDAFNLDKHLERLGLNPGGPGRGPPHVHHEHAPVDPEPPLDLPVLGRGAAAPLCADRLTFSSVPPAFDAALHLPGFELAAFLQPEMLEYPGRPTGKPSPPPAKQGGDRDEVLAVLRAWDRSGRLALFPGGVCPPGRRMKLKAVVKDEVKDRLICDRQRRNEVEHRLLGASGELPGAAALTDIVLEPTEVLSVWSSDLRDMYHSFVVSPARAATNVIAFPLAASEAEGFPNAWRDAGRGKDGAKKNFPHSLVDDSSRHDPRKHLLPLRREKEDDNEDKDKLFDDCVCDGGFGKEVAEHRVSHDLVNNGSRHDPRMHSLPLRRGKTSVDAKKGKLHVDWVPAFRTLPMGDGIAVDIACRSHASVLEGGGVLKPPARVRGVLPLPRGSSLDLLVIDDLVSVVRHHRRDKQAKDTGNDKQDKAKKVYTENGLEMHGGKVVRGERSATVLGAWLDGDAGLISASGDKLLRISSLSFALGRCRRVRGDIVRKVLSHWVFVLGFCRHGLAIFASAFRWLGPVSGDGVLRPFPRGVASEFILAATLAPLFVSDLRAPVLDEVWAVDASEFGLGGASAPLPATAAREAWRVRDRRGAATRLEPALVARMRAAGLAADADVQADIDDGMAEAKPRVERILVETFDIIEVFSGRSAPLLRACAARGLRVGPRIDLNEHIAWDILRPRVWEWLFFLVERDRVFYIHLGPPCTTFSVARQPHARTRDEPWGKHPRGDAVKSGNAVFQLCLALVFRVLAPGTRTQLTLEHPSSAFSWKTPQLGRLVRRAAACDGGGGLVDFDVCAFGRGVAGDFYRKPTRLFWARASWATRLARRCPGHHAHVPLAGRVAARAAEYIPELVMEWAALLAEARRADARGLGQDDVDFVNDFAHGPAEALWVNELVGGLSFKKEFSIPVPSSKHINVRELEAQVAVLRRLASSGAGPCRVIDLVDSKVTMGVILKGRSGSRALNRVWSRALPYALGSGITLGPVYVPSRKNPADGPSRLGPVPAAVHGPPAFANDEGDIEDLSRWVHLPRQRRGGAEWARFIAKLVFSAGRRPPVAFKDFDATLGYPGEGPRRQALPLADRPAVDLTAAPDRTEPVLHRRAVLLDEFRNWWGDGVSPDGAWIGDSAPSLVVSRSLASFGQHLYDMGRPLGAYLETVNAMVDLRPELRGNLALAWRVGWSWRGLVPARNHRPMPAPVLLAAVAAALLDNAVDLAIVLSVGFVAALRPAEVSNLRVRDLLMPSRTLGRAGCFYVFVDKPKMRRLAARHEHVLVEQPGLTQFLEAVIPQRAADELVFRDGPRALSVAFDEVVRRLGVPGGALTGMSLASLRAGGATWLFEVTRDLELVRWRGRWASRRTLEVYIQEIASDALLAEVPDDVRQRVRDLARAAPSLMARWVVPSAGRGGPSPRPAPWASAGLPR